MAKASRSRGEQLVTMATPFFFFLYTHLFNKKWMLQSKEPMVMRACECKWKFWLWGVERKWGNQNLLSRVNLKTKEISFWLSKKEKKKKVYCKKRINKCLVEPYSGSTSNLKTSWQEYRRFISRIRKKQLYEYFLHHIKKYTDDEHLYSIREKISNSQRLPF